ncbi:MAG TPA: methyltransferase domain-containing protein [Thermoleophilaceae bacterium]|nr:methyltransferase domain-containing protein [Thermoleophilaceae bacterium]
MAQLEFDEGVVRQLEEVYTRRDMLRRRRLVREALGAAPGQRILDVGCGPGFYVGELLDEVGPEGSVVGVDGSAASLAVAARRNQGHPNVAFHEADATALPVGDAEFDAALSVQVLEYVADVTAALREMHRALRPGGRVVIWDVDWATVSMRTEDDARMARALAAWDSHLTHVSLPRTLGPLMREAGFEDVRMDGHTFATDEQSPETYGGFLVEFAEEFVVKQGLLEEAEARAWADEQRELEARGDFYFACIQFCFRGSRPAG